VDAACELRFAALLINVFAGASTRGIGQFKFKAPRLQSILPSNLFLSQINPIHSFVSFCAFYSHPHPFLLSIIFVLPIFSTFHIIMATNRLILVLRIEMPPLKRRRGLAGSIISTAVSAALIGSAVGLTVYRL
jgi:hypothetical protein